MIDLSNKVALITGGSRGIGRATALKLSSQGAKVAINYKNNKEAAELVVAEIKDINQEAIALQGSVAIAADAKRIVDETVARLGAINILINNAGINKDNLLIRMKEDEWNAVIDTNLKGTFNCTQAAAKKMIKNRDGTIINLSSVVALSGNAGQANYSAAKAGIIGLTKTTAKELASRGIRVNALAPGFIDTEMTQAIPTESREKIAKRIPLGRFGSAEDVANLIAFLVSDEAAYITGQVFVVDGGLNI